MLYLPFYVLALCLDEDSRGPECYRYVAYRSHGAWCSGSNPWEVRSGNFNALQRTGVRVFLTSCRTLSRFSQVCPCMYEGTLHTIQ